MLPEAKLDILLAHHASLEAELLGQVNSEKYVQITRELAELNPLIDAVKAYRAARAEIAGAEQLLAVMNSTRDALFTLDAQGQILSCNQAARQLFMLDEPASRGHIQQLLPTDRLDSLRDMPSLMAIYRDLHANPELSSHEVRSAAIMA